MAQEKNLHTDDPRNECLWYQDTKFTSVATALGRFGVRTYGDVSRISLSKFEEAGVLSVELSPLRGQMLKRGLDFADDSHVVEFESS